MTASSSHATDPHDEGPAAPAPAAPSPAPPEADSRGDGAATDSPRAEALRARIEQRSARVAVIGLGYVGLPLAVGLAEQGFPVTGIDVDEDRVRAIADGQSPIADVPHAQLAALTADGALRATDDVAAVAEAEVLFICVPTPFDRHKTPDLRYVIAAADGIAQHVHPGLLVVLQSTTYPGTTSEVFRPRLERDGLVAGRDYFLAFSPERIDPGVPQHTVMNTPKVVGGVTETCTALAAAVLGTLGTEVHTVSSPRVAEMTKLLENIYRSVNIALVNELALLSERMEIDLWEVIEAAATKPFGFMPFWPGAGVGGHCIPIDPYYLSWKAREVDFPTRFIELAGDINGNMPHHAAELVSAALNRAGTATRGAQVLVLGVAFKPNVDDARHSPAERLMALLAERGAQLSYHDPHVETFGFGGDAFLEERHRLQSQPLDDDTLRRADVVVILARHAAVDYARVCRLAKLVVDTSNATRDVTRPAAQVLRLGAPWPPMSGEAGESTPRRSQPQGGDDGPEA